MKKGDQRETHHSIHHAIWRLREIGARNSPQTNLTHAHTQNHSAVT